MIRGFRNLIVGGLFGVGLALQGLAGSAADSVDAPETWITGIAGVSGQPTVYAATAKGLLLREAPVLRMSPGSDAAPEVLYEHPAGVWDVVTTPDGTTVASVDYKGNLITYQIEESKHQMHEGAFQRWCQALIASGDSKSLVAGNEAGELMVWDLASASVSKTVKLDGHAISDLAWAKDSSALAATDGAGQVHLVQWPSLQVIGKVSVGTEPAWCVAFSDETSCWVGSGDRNVYRILLSQFSEAAAKAQTPNADQEDTNADDAQGDQEQKEESSKDESANEENVDPAMAPSFQGKDWITQLVINDDGEIAVAEIGGAVHLLRSQPDGKLTKSVQLDSPSGVWALRWSGSRLLIGTRKHGLRVAARSWKWLDE